MKTYEKKVLTALPLKYCKCNLIDDFTIRFEYVDFLEDFGIIKKDFYCDELFIHLDTSEIAICDQGVLLKKFEYNIIPL